MCVCGGLISFENITEEHSRKEGTDHAADVADEPQSPVEAPIM